MTIKNLNHNNIRVFGYFAVISVVFLIIYSSISTMSINNSNNANISNEELVNRLRTHLSSLNNNLNGLNIELNTAKRIESISNNDIINNSFKNHFESFENQNKKNTMLSVGLLLSNSMKVNKETNLLLAMTSSNYMNSCNAFGLMRSEFNLKKAILSHFPRNEQKSATTFYQTVNKQMNRLKNEFNESNDKCDNIKVKYSITFELYKLFHNQVCYKFLYFCIFSQLFPYLLEVIDIVD